MNDIPGQRRDPDDVVIVYTAKELLARIEKTQTEGFTTLLERLNGKADKSDIVRLEKTIGDHQTRIGELERRQDNDDVARQTTEQVKERRTDWHRWLYPTLAAVGLTTITVLQATGILK